MALAPPRPQDHLVQPALGRIPCYQWERRRISDYWGLSGLSHLLHVLGCASVSVRIGMCTSVWAWRFTPMREDRCLGPWVCGGGICFSLAVCLSVCLLFWSP